MPQIITLVRSIPPKFVLRPAVFIVMICGFAGVCPGQTRSKTPPQATAQEKASSDDISGMYTFLREGEFVQFTVEDGKLSGFVSRYGERDSDKDAFLDQFFSKAALDGKKITFATKPVHGTWFEFEGEVSRGDAKTPDKEGYWIVRGNLKQYDEDESRHVSAKSRQVTFKSFPQDLDGDQDPR